MSIQNARLCGSSMALAIALGTAAVAVAAPAQPYTESFPTDAANWQTGIFATPTFIGAGSFDGSSYISTTVDLASGSGFGLTVFRAQLDLGSSDGLFAGDYITGGITTLTFQVRHDAPEALSGFVRFAAPANSPAVAWFFDAVPSGEWTQITLNLDPNDPNYVPAGGTYESVMPNVGNLQLSFSVPAGTTGDATFDIDQVSIVPAPAGLLAFAPLGLAAARRRRTR